MSFDSLLQPVWTRLGKRKYDDNTVREYISTRPELGIKPATFNHDQPQEIKQAVRAYLEQKPEATSEAGRQLDAMLKRKPGDRIPVDLPRMNDKEKKMEFRGDEKKQATIIHDQLKDNPTTSLAEELSMLVKGKKPREGTPEVLAVRPVNEKMRKDNIPKMPYGELVGQHPFRAMFVGQSNSGKTVLLTFLIKHHYSKYFDKIFVYSPTAAADDTWANILEDPKKQIIKVFDEEKLLQALYKAYQDAEKKGVDRLPRVLIFFDDEASTPSVMHSLALLKLSTIGRHASISTGIATQKYNLVSKTTRTNQNIIFAFAFDNNAELETFAEEQSGSLLNKHQFTSLYRDMLFDDDNPTPYEFITINHQCPDKTKVFRRNLDEVIVLNPKAIKQSKNTRSITDRMTSSEDTPEYTVKPTDSEPSATHVTEETPGPTEPPTKKQKAKQ